MLTCSANCLCMPSLVFATLNARATNISPILCRSYVSYLHILLCCMLIGNARCCLMVGLTSNIVLCSTSCTVCCDDYESGDALRVLKCGHKYHVECIDKWLLSSTDYLRAPACPICSAALSTEEH